MQRIAAIDPATASAAVAPQFAAVRSMLGAVPNLFRVTAQSPAALTAMVALFGASAKTSFAPAVREQIALRVAELNGCGYCLSAHGALAQANGLSGDAIDAARDGHADTAHTDAALAFASEIVTTRGRVGGAALDAARSAGLTDAQMLDILLLVTLNIFTNYVNLTAQTEIDFPLLAPRLAQAA